MKRIVLAVLASGIWINASEFLRNEIVCKHLWLDKYLELGQPFPAAPINNALWVLWGFVLAGCITFMARKQTFATTMLLCWTLAFFLMWVVLWNLNVLPPGLLYIAVPWSLVEIAVAVLIAKGIARPIAAE